jgi:ribosomal-protein-alanine N-acetyltransferase
MNNLIRPMIKEDLPSIISIETHIQAYPWTEKMFLDCFNNHEYEAFVLEYSNEISAYLITQSILDECHILTIGVAENFQNQGLASKLINFLIKHLEHQPKNCQRILLEVAESNLSAINLYKKFEFNQIGLRKNYYQNVAQERSDNALVFEKLLSNQ